MELNFNPSAIGVVLILMAAASLFTMFSLTQINYIVHNDLYNYNLQFSYRWAMPYWVFSGIVFGLSWVNISLSMIVTLYIFKKTRNTRVISEADVQVEKIKAATQLGEEKEQRKLNEYVDPQKEELTAPKEETSSGEFIEEEVEQPEVIEPVEAQEIKNDQQKTEEDIELSEEPEEVPVPTEDIEPRQSIL